LHLSAFLGQLTYIIYCAFIVYSAFRHASVFVSFVQSNLQFKMFVFSYLSVGQFCQPLFDYYPIIVRLVFSILIQEMYFRYFDLVINSHLPSQ
jgi:hypothetical protein